MSKFIPTTKRNGECEVCGDLSGKCRRLDELDLCMTFADAKVGDVQNGRKCIKADTKSKGWASFKLDNSQDWTEQQRQQWQAKAQQRRQEQSILDADRKAQSLSAIERDRAYQKLLSELDLHPDDRADLIRRGLTNQQIERGEFRSVERYQQLQNQYPDLLPGIHSNEQTLINTNAGYLCILRDKDGLRVAAQIRLRVLSGDSKCRYLWLSGQKSKGILHLFPDKGDPAGELPLTVCRPESAATGIALAEGTGAKPLLTSQRLKLVTVGAAGGQWASSPAILRETLEQLSAELKTREIVLFPDAGDVQNDRVMPRWDRLITLLKHWKFKPKIGWWEQVGKTDCDIDELPLEELEHIHYLSPAQFKSIAFLQGGLDQPTTQKERKAQQRDHRRQLARQHYHRLSQLTSERFLTVNTPKLNFEELGLERGAVYIICSAKGTSKTEAAIPLMSQFKNVYAWFSRIALGREECHRLNLTWREEMGGYQGFLKVGFCSNSAYKFNPRHLQDQGLLLIDECDQLFDHGFSTICNRDGIRPLILNALPAQMAAALAGGGTVLFMSADVTDRDVDYIKALTPPDVPVRLIVNEYQPQRGQVLLNEAKTPEAQIDRLLQTLEAGTPCFVIDDLKDGVRGCKSIAKFISQRHPEWADRIVEINSETSCTEIVQQFLTNINDASKSILLLCCSPSVVSGISITNGHFNQGVFGFFNGVLTVSQASQALARVRGAAAIHCWASQSGICWAANRSTDPQAIKRWYQTNYETNSKYLGSFVLNYCTMQREFESPHFDLFCKNAAYRNVCQTDFRALLREQLEREGYTVESVQSEAASEELIKAGLQQSWQAIEFNKVRAMGAMELLSDQELSQKMNSATRPTVDEQRQIEKTLLYKQFGQELIDSLSYTHKQSGEVFTGFEAAALKNRQNRYYKELEAFHLLQSPTIEAALRDWERENKQLRQAGERFVGDVRWLASQRELREQLGLTSLQPHIWYSPTDLQPIVDRARKNAQAIKDILNCSIEQMSDGQVIAEMFRQVGLIFDEIWITPAGGGKRYKQRRINQESWEQAWQFVRYRESLKAQPEPEAETVVETLPVPVADHPPVDLSSEAIGGGDQQLVTETALSTATSHVSAIEVASLSPVNVPVLTAAECLDGAIEAQSPASLNTPESIADIAQMLGDATTPEQVQAMRTLTGMTQAVWQAVSQRLKAVNLEQFERVKQWARQLKRSGQFMSSSA